MNYISLEDNKFQQAYRYLQLLDVLQKRVWAGVGAVDSHQRQNVGSGAQLKGVDGHIRGVQCIFVGLKRSG